MYTWIALLRGINVGGNTILPMKGLVQVLESLDLRDIQTYIQSGNAVFRSSSEVSPTLGDQIALGIENRQGFRPHVLILSADQLKAAHRSSPTSLSASSEAN